MKTSHLFVLTLVSFAVGARGQGVGSGPANSTTPAPTPYTVISRDANSAVWQRMIYEPAPGGKFIPHKDRYVELATGLNHLVKGKYVPSSDQIKLSPDRTSAEATNGQHQAYFPNDIATGTIKLVTPGGRQLISRPIALAYDNGSNTVLIALVTNSVGAIMGANQVIYTNAFQGVSAALRYTYTRAGFEQDVVLEGQLPSPQSLGLDPQTTKLQVVTEFFNPPQPRQRRGPINPQNGLRDTTLSFGRMTMVQGRAFSIHGQKGQHSRSGGTPTYKRWLNLEGRTFLIENVPYNSIRSQVQTLPAQASATVSPPSSLLDKVLTLRRLLKTYPVKMAMGNGASKPMRQLAQADFQRKSGVVLDYQMLNGTLTNYTFQGNTTYYISGNVTMYGVITFEGGAVIKYTNNAALVLTIGPIPLTINWLAGPYRPIVFTAMDDNSVGATISGSTGNPSGYYANPALQITVPSVAPTITSFHIAYARQAIKLITSGVHFHDGQIIDCQNGISDVQSYNVQVQNVLFAGVQTNFNYLYGASYDVENSTFSSSAYLTTIDDTPYQNVALNFTNCIFSDVTNLQSVFSYTNEGSYQVSGNYNGFCNSPEFGSDTVTDNSYPFQSVGGGSYYLADGCPFLNVGTTNIDPTLLADLATKTTYPPIAYTNVTFATAQTFSPQAQRDTDTPDLGYHYAPLDYVFGGCTADSNLTFTTGTAAGWFRTTSGFRGYGQPPVGQGIFLENLVNASFEGTEESPDYWVRLNTVQENDTSGGYGPGGITGGDNQYNENISLSPVVNLSFTYCTTMASDNNFFRDDWGYLIVQAKNSEFYDGGISGYVNSCYLTNCFMHRMGGAQVQGWPGDEYVLQNCTWIGGTLTFNPNNTAIPLTVHDCTFEGTTFNISNYGTNTAYISYDYNAYTNGAPQLPYSGTHDVIVTNGFNWQAGPLGNYYLPTSSPLINKGNVPASQVGLYHYTVQTNLVWNSAVNEYAEVPEGTNIVSIGYHYVTVDANGNPLDSNKNGIPDYLEDANGNGIVDNGESPWGVGITQQPTNETAYVGDTVTFSVGADGVQPLNYRWFFNGNSINGATGATFTIPVVQTNNAGNYSVRVSNSTGSTNSVTVSLTVNTPAYTVLFGSLTNYTFRGNTTYYIVGTVNMYGTSTFEGGAVLKYATDVSLNLSDSTQINCLTAPYRPVIFTAKDDNSVGETISGSTGSPTNYYANPAIYYSPSDQGYDQGTLILSHFRIAYASEAVFASAANMNVSLQDAQIVDCGTGFYTPGQTQLSLRNMLFANIQFPFDVFLANIHAQNVTFVGQLPSPANNYNVSFLVVPANNGPDYPISLNLVNCILANFELFSVVGSGIPISGDHNGFYNNGSSAFGSSPIICTNNPFQAVGAGDYYLTNGCAFINAGTTNIDPTLLADLQRETTYPPILLTGSISVNTNLMPQVPRNTGIPDLGYHYDPLDYLLSNVNLSATLTLTNGVAVGILSPTNYAINLLTGANVVSFGLPQDFNEIVSYQNVQEESSFAPEISFIGGGRTSDPQFRFTDFSVGQGTDGDIFAAFFQSLTFRDCHLRDSHLSVDVTSPAGNEVFDLINNLILRGNVSVNSEEDGYFNCYNNLFKGGSLSSYVWGTYPWIIRDNLFDGATQSATYFQFPPGYPIQMSNPYEISNNGFTTGTANSLGGNNNQIGFAADYQAGPLGHYYLPPDSPLIDAGNVPASQVGLFHFTTQTNQMIDGFSPVDIGYHYVVVDANGNPLDSNGDGTPDYLEDANGNGVVDNGETAWTDDLNLDGLTEGQDTQYGINPQSPVIFEIWISTPAVSSDIP